VTAYLGVVIAPLVFAAIGGSQPALGFWTNFSVAVGFVGLAMMGLEFALVARFQPVAAPFGQDTLLQFHREIGYVGLGFVLLHVALSAHWRELWAKLTFSSETVATPALVILGSVALLAVIVLVVTSEWRRHLRLSYEWWHAIHTLLAVVAVVGALVHVYLVDGYVNAPWKRALWGLMSAVFLGLLGWVPTGQAARHEQAPMAPRSGGR
jgi:predicted ferric reductase